MGGTNRKELLLFSSHIKIKHAMGRCCKTKFKCCRVTCCNPCFQPCCDPCFQPCCDPCFPSCCDPCCQPCCDPCCQPCCDPCCQPCCTTKIKCCQPCCKKVKRCHKKKRHSCCPKKCDSDICSFEDVCCDDHCSFSSCQHDCDTPPFAQLSSSVDQVLGPLGQGTIFSFNTTDGSNCVEVFPDGKRIIIKQSGLYSVTAAPQVGVQTTSTVSQWTADFWFAVNNQNIVNSNARIQATDARVKGILTNQQLLKLHKNDILQVIGAGTASNSSGTITGAVRIETLAQSGEPSIPSITLSLVRQS